MTDYTPAKYNYTKKDTAFAWLIAAMFMCYYDAVLHSTLGLAAAVFMVVLYAATAVYLGFRGVNLKRAWYFAALGVLLSLSLVFTDSMNTKKPVFLFVSVLYILWLLYVCGNNADDRLDMLWYDGLKAMFVMPLSSLGRIFGAIFCRKGESRGKKALMVLGGIALAFIPTFIVVLLLAHADYAFSAFLREINLAKLLFVDFIPRLFICVCFASPVFGAVYANAGRLYPQSFAKERNMALRNGMAKLPTALVYASVTPMLVVYATFFVMQFRYFTSAFASVLPEGQDNYAEYARRGFFELCAVAVINVVVILCISLFVKRIEGKKPTAARIYCSLYAVASIAFSAIALSKMILYIRKFGLTQLRLYTGYFMLALSVIFILVLLRQIKQNFAFMRSATAIVCLFAAVFAFGRFDKIIADYNVDAYLSGRHAGIDIPMLYNELSSDALPALERLCSEAKDETVKKEAEHALEYVKWRSGQRRAIDFNITYIGK